ncbi:sec-independent translocase [Streptomyces nanshensis]|uniref:Sec-independent protein translocase protein TatB n=1 Tax=Streptomyces nanshensis TaxID=518642 RepID=A0A1E7JZG2_9ACTN|nr:sec-independent translocase [Streptomyces nanshensis]OEU96986.1 hypothetical protein AN218_33630 [Streptomyces nanshensis]
MFFDIGPLELVALVVLAVLVFGPEKLPKVIQDVAAFIRKVRAFSENAKEDIRSELGPEFKDFEFEDLNPKTFARKHLLDGDDLGVKELRNTFDFRDDLAEVTDAVNGTESVGARSSSNGSSGGSGSGSGSRTSLSKGGAATGLDASDPLSKESPRERPKDDPPPFDADAT